jgi:DNA primase
VSSLSETLKDIKKKINEENKIQYLLEKLGCKYIKLEQNNTLITAGLPDGFESNNRRTIQVKNNENLTSYIRSFDVNGDIFSIIAFIKRYELPQDIIYVKDIACNLLGYNSYGNITSEKNKKSKDWIGFLHKIKNKRIKKSETYINEQILSEIILEQYIKNPVYEWYLEGLKLKTQREFEIYMDISYGEEKIVFPMRNEDNKLVSVKARVCHKYESYHKDMKYFYLYPYDRRIHLYNYFKAKSYVKKQKIVYVVEGAKTTMFSWQYGIKNIVSTEGSEITEEQIRKLLDLNAVIVFVFDKDIDDSFYKEKLINKYNYLLLNRLCYYIIDKNNLLGEKELVDDETGEIIVNKASPTDKGKEIYLQLIDKSNWIKLGV